MPEMSNDNKALTAMSAFGGELGELNVIIETPKGSRNKFKYNEKQGLFVLSGVLPAGAVFPFDFGYVPSTKGGDGDPLDVLVLMDEPAFPGCLVQARIIGVIEAEQTERDGEVERNDRLIAVAAESRTHRDVRSLEQVSENLVGEIEHFFVSYNQIKGKEFKPLGRYGSNRARQVVEEALRGGEQASGVSTTREGKKSNGKSKSKKTKRQEGGA